MATKKQDTSASASEQKTTKVSKKPAAKKTEMVIETPVIEEKAAETPSKERGRDNGPIILGLGLLIMGVLLLGGNLLNIPFGNYLWPFIFVIPGGLLFFAAVSTNRTNGEGLAIVGGIFGMLGLVFLMQTITGFWATWAYIWALVAPTSIGLSQMFYGNVKKDDAIVQTGWNLTRIGLSILAVGFVFFELIIGLSGFGLGRFGLPIFPMILIFVGGFLLLRSLIRSR